MPFDASGNFTRSYNFTQDRDNGIKILASHVDGEFDNFSTGMNLVFFRDGRVPMSADLRMNINGITGLKDGAAGTPAIKFNTDTTTGPYLDGISRYAVSVNGTRRMVATTTGVDVTGNFSASGQVALTTSTATPSPSGTAQGFFSTNSSSGLNLIGQGSTFDISFNDSGGTRRAAINTGGNWQFFGSPTSTTPTTGDNTTRIATTAFVQAQLTANAYAPLASPTFTGTPAAPTPTTGDNTTRIATTAFVQAQLTANAYATLASPTFTGTPVAPTPLTADNSTAIATTAFVKAQAYAPLASPTFTGTPAAPTATGGTNTTQIATTAFVTTAVTGLAPTASPTFTGTPAAPTPATADNTTKIATTAYVQANLVSYATLASPTFTGTPVAPTPTAGDNTTKIATTAFVTAAVAAINTQTVASSATVTPTFSNDAVDITAQAVALNLANWTGTAVNFAGVVIRIKDNGTARAIAYGTNYLAIDNVTLPTTTVVGKTHELCFEHNSTTGKHMCVSAITY
jgi:hypothetical protein